ncbi:MAG: hypothetical protein JO316_16740 [Abitibacteriaceae bacterium]|nr:hypothetical protein [Abditibacteriaceae bacterium]
MTHYLFRKSALLGKLIFLVLGLTLGFKVNLPTQAADTTPATVPAAPTGVTAHWAGTDPNGHPTGVVLTWNPVPGATSYNIYRRTQVVPQPADQTALFKRGETDTTFIDPTVSMGVDVVYVYQVTAVNKAGESPKSNAVSPALPVADVPTVIQGNVTEIKGTMVKVKTPDIRPPCPPGEVCAQYIILGVTFQVDLSSAIFERADGTPITTPKLAKGDAIVVAGHKAPVPAIRAVINPAPLITAQVVELLPQNMPVPAPTSGIEGVAQVGPISPVEQPGQPDTKPLPDAIITVQPDGGGPEIARQRTDASGHFRIPLPPGTYLIVPLPPKPGQTLPSGTQQTVTVTQDKFLHVVVSYDSGIR